MLSSARGQIGGGDGDRGGGGGGRPWLRPGLRYSTRLADFDIPSMGAQTVYVTGDKQGLVGCFMGCGVCLLITRLCDVSLITPTGII